MLQRVFEDATEPEYGTSSCLNFNDPDLRQTLLGGLHRRHHHDQQDAEPLPRTVDRRSSPVNCKEARYKGNKIRES